MPRSRRQPRILAKAGKVTMRPRKECKFCRKIVSTLRLEEPINKYIGIDVTILGTLKELLHDSVCQAHKAIVMSTLEVIGRKNTDQSLCLTAPPLKQISYFNEPWGVGPRLHVLQRPPLPPKYLGEGGGVINGKWIDRNLPFRWKVRCATKHRSGMCQQQFPNQMVASARPEWLVDVWQRCLVRATESVPYVALSYVWGGSKSFNFLQRNVHELQIPSALSVENKDVVLPKTVCDAMGLVELLRERYLWVDLLCIVQDGPEKQLELARMSAIYANATVTIIAADGFGAEHGLRGLSGISTPRCIRQKVFRLGRGRYILEDDDAPGIGAEERSVWSTRGWTFQEQLFSRRRLFFERGQVVWRCTGASWSEAEESTGTRQTGSNDDQQDISMFLQGCPNVGLLVVVLHQYNRRNFTYPEDCLRAFDGIAYALESSYEGGFVSGLPVAFFGIALLWQPCEQAVRRVAANKESDENCLPSWSWAGWKAGLDLTNWYSVMDYIKHKPSAVPPGAIYYHAFSTVAWAFRKKIGDEATPIRESWQKQRVRYSRGEEDTMSCPPGWTRHGISDFPYRKGRDRCRPLSSPTPSRWVFKHASDTDNEYWYPIPIPANNSPKSEPRPLSVSVPFISGRARRGWAIGGEKFKAPYPTIYLQDGSGKWIGAMQLHDDDNAWEPGANNAYKWLELVEIARGQYPESFPHESFGPPKEGREARPRSTDGYVRFYFVLWIEWEGDIAYRRGLGRVEEEAWEALDLEEIDLMLG